MTKLDPEVIEDIMLSPDGEDGNFVTDEEPEFEEPELEVDVGEVDEQFGEYQEELIDDMRKHPDEYYVETPEGLITITEAFEKGWDPESGEFGEPFEEHTDDILASLSDSDQEAIRAMTDPSAAQIPQGEAEMYGLDGGNPMVAQGGMPLDGGMADELI